MQYIKSNRVVLGNNLQPGAILFEAGKIVAIAAVDQIPDDCQGTDYDDLVVMPGLVDSHVHINEPGRTDWEGFETGTRAAAAGGITTLIDMPLNSSPATTNVTALNLKKDACSGKTWIDCGFYGGLIEDNSPEIEALCMSGVLGIKAFLCDSAIEDFPKVTEADLHSAFPVLARHHVPLLVHSELEEENQSLDLKLESNPTVYDAFLRSRPAAWECSAIEFLIKLCRQYNTPVHIVHLSTAEALPMIASAKEEGMPLSVETCPHYLYFSAEEISKGDTRFKCTPPIREKTNQELLCHAVKTRIIDTIGSDHSPCLPELKDLNRGSFIKAWGGISSIQLLLSAAWTATSIRGVTLPLLSHMLSTNPAKLLQLESKGQLAPGKDADFVVWDPEASFEVDVRDLFHRHKVTPYQDQVLQGRVTHTYLRGQLVYSEGKIIGGPAGRIVER